MERGQGLIGIGVLLLLAVAMSSHRRRIDWRLVATGLALQFVFALFILKTPLGRPCFDVLNAGFSRVIDFAQAGTTFLFRPLSDALVTRHEVLPPEEAPPGETSSAAPEREEATPPWPAGSRVRLRWLDSRHIAAPLMNIAVVVLPTVIFFSGLLAVLYHLGVMQAVIRGIAWLMVRTMRTSGAETLCVAANIFVGQTEAPLMVRPFLAQMTRSELLTVMVGGFATIAGGVMALYIGMLSHALPDIAGHLMAASVMSAPAALVIAKILQPETDEPVTLGDIRVRVPRTAGNVVEAFGDGVTSGLQLALNIGAMLIAFVAAVALVNGVLGLIPLPAGAAPLTLQGILGIVFRPLAWTLGVPWSEAELLGTLLGEKLVATELVAYSHLQTLTIGVDLSRRTAVIASYALCGFANFASVGIQLGGIGAMAPERKGDLAQLALRAMLGGALASWLTAAIAGLLL